MKYILVLAILYLSFAHDTSRDPAYKANEKWYNNWVDTTQTGDDLTEELVEENQMIGVIVWFNNVYMIVFKLPFFERKSHTLSLYT
jgi:hypothetical protein